MSIAFGSEVTVQLLRVLPWYRGRDINQEDLAREATRMIQARNINMEALNHVVNLKRGYGTGCSTLCMVYNATGTTLDLVETHHWSGRIYQQEPPRRLLNGQWMSFLHVRTGGPRNDSCGALVFRGTNIRGFSYDFLVAWKTPWDGGNKVLTEIRDVGHFPRYWGYLYDLLGRCRKVHEDRTHNSFISNISVGGVTSPECVAVLQHRFEPLPEER